MFNMTSIFERIGLNLVVSSLSELNNSETATTNSRQLQSTDYPTSRPTAMPTHLLTHVNVSTSKMGLSGDAIGGICIVGLIVLVITLCMSYKWYLKKDDESSTVKSEVEFNRV
jgi:hypothetical protein